MWMIHVGKSVGRVQGTFGRTYAAEALVVVPEKGSNRLGRFPPSRLLTPQEELEPEAT